jgi:protein-tyrosine kinase
MSRIEQALEKAVKMRETQKEVTPDQNTVSSKLSILPESETLTAVIDPAEVDKHIVTLTDPHSAAAEQYKRLRVRVIKATRNDSRNTIMITSSDIGEGKSMTAINFAVSLSHEVDLSVLLVDADLRRPSLHKYLHIEPRYGLSDYLKGDVQLSDVLIKTNIGNMVFLPGGNPSDNATDLLSSEKMKMLVHEMKLRYKDRYVIFDTSPLLVTADPLSLGSYMDGILLVIQEGRTSQKDALQSISLMKGWNILGVVFNNVPKYLPKSLYPYYYQYSSQDKQNKSDQDNRRSSENTP